MARPISVICLAFAASALSTGPALAEDAALQTSLAQCARLRNNAERLACYDSLATGESQRQAVSDEEMFGMRSELSRKVVPNSSAPERKETASITAHVQALERAADGRLVIALDNGQRWRQESSTELLLEIGDAVTIERGAMSSFRLISAKKRFARVKRVE